MGMSITLQQYLDNNHVEYETLTHKKTSTMLNTAEAAHLSGRELAKAVIVKRKKGYLMAIVPASRKLDLSTLGDWLNQTISLATEEELVELFPDCSTGAIPALGAPFGIKSVIDQELSGLSDIYFEAGDHQTLIHVTGNEYDRLTARWPHNECSMQGESQY